MAAPVADAIVRALDPRADETVVEIGAGTGTLARMIAPRAARVLAIERDRDLARALRAEALHARIDVREDDAASFDYGAVAAQGPTSIVGNLPYQITGRLLRALLAPPVRWRVAVVMVQREVARRLCARPGDADWGVLSVFAQAACEVARVVDASPRCFHPSPRVHSTVVRLVPRAVPRAAETPAFRRVVHALFAARRKTVRNGLAALVGREQAAAACARAGVDPGARPETLTIEALAALTRASEPGASGP